MRAPPQADNSSIEAAKPTAGIGSRAPSRVSSAVVAAAGDQRAFGARIVQLEHEAGVVVEAAAEPGRELDRPHIDAARGEKAGAGLEQIERRRQRELGVGGERAQFAGGFVGIAAHGEEALDQRARLARQPRSGAERRLFEEALGDLGDRAAADRFDAGNGEKVGDEMMRRLRVGTGERGKHALIFRPAVGRGQSQLIEIVRQRPLPVEILDQAAFPGRRQIERGDEGGEQPDVADADFRRGQPIERGGFEPERQHFRVRRRFVRPAEGFDAGLQEFRRRAFAMAKHGAEIAITGRLAGRRRLQVGARHRNGEVGPQAQFAAQRIAGEEHAPTDVLA